ncbi:MAG: hypothetical protein ACR2PO_18120 [Methyloligellaceae bacterium]
MNTRLPPTPDFESMEAAAGQTVDQRTNILALIGNLSFSWSNNESMFIYVLQVLLETDFTSAAITFVTLNTTRARLDLIRRLAKYKVPDPAVVRKLERLIERFNRCTKLRNEFNHCIYQLDETGQITHTNVLRIHETKKEMTIATLKKMDAARLREITNTVRRLRTINRDIWAFLTELEAAVGNKNRRGSKSRK